MKIILLLTFLVGCSALSRHGCALKSKRKMAHFKKYDTNNDGKWDHKEWMGKFKAIDKNGDGFVTLEEKKSFKKSYKRHH